MSSLGMRHIGAFTLRVIPRKVVHAPTNIFNNTKCRLNQSKLVRMNRPVRWNQRALNAIAFNSDDEQDIIVTKNTSAAETPAAASSSCGYISQNEASALLDIDNDDEDDDHMEEMFVEPHPSLFVEKAMLEWGGPTRGGRLQEPTRFGDWERKGRCTDF
mmetsp:Transcript_2573/g.3943  ORF Transcript_2573/g.3943 Transcript_2573/m.3943 type:complete len:159 (-) Transcript_2573:331-807(-)|eukprot:CAMPEP_0195521456 /NCGR_PEP_ID=MMETSP0794_2-20130614/18719_1 /TAXON_ID=515487 /ORGANISM="Stephanopyxis turris, Strain CCMP 815" /LENGTH=158 /DNA_ID=CAMNT_0040651019 /DNA_START=94 /DNA_END=570 /DNA_ORIENTATION=+